MAGTKNSSSKVRVLFSDSRPDKAMFFNAFFVEEEEGYKIIHFALRNRVQVVLDDFICSITTKDIQNIAPSMNGYIGSLGPVEGDVDSYKLSRPSPEKRIIRNVRVIHAANSSEVAEITLYEFSIWQVSTKSRGSPEPVQAICAAVLACPLDVMKALFLEVFK